MFQREQRHVAIGMALAVTVTVLVLGASLFLGARGASEPLLSRVATAFKADVFVVLWLAAAIGNVARIRFFSPQDIGGSGTGAGSTAIRTASAVLQNTLEQVTLAVPVHVALAVVLAGSVPTTIALAGLFCAGRFLFWIGYGRGAAGRAFGFALTFYPSLAALVIVIVVLAGKMLA